MVTIRLFGHPRYESDPSSVVPFRVPPRAVAMLAYLIVHHVTPVARHFLAELLWPDDDIEAGRAKVRRHVHLLMQSLPTAPEDRPYLLGTMQSLRWNPGAPAVVDTLAFENAVRAGSYTEALRWYGGDFLESFSDDWIVAERERLRSTQLESLADAIERLRAANDPGAAAAYAERMLEIDPWREDAMRNAMSLRAQLGDRGGALALYRAYGQRLRAELDAEPAPETRAVYEALRRGEEPRRSVDGDMPPTAPEEPAQMPFSGRATEMRILTGAWSQAAYGHGGMVMISGEAGVGKSRLAQELVRHVEREGGGVLLGVTSPGETQPYEAVLDALRGSLGPIIASQTPEQLGILARALPEIAARTGVAEPITRGAEADRERLFTALYDAVAALARRRPLLVVLEDLQWLPASSAALVEYLVRRVATLPVLVVGTVRDGDAGRSHPLRGLRRRLASEGTLRHIALGRLAHDDVAAIVRSVAGIAGTPALAERLYAISEGVPFFLEAALYAGDRPPANDRPDTVARMERLGESARMLLGIAAVAGAGFSVEVLGEVAGWSESEILLALDELVEARFVREGRQRRFGDYAFTHHLIHASVYERVSESTRRRRHALVARAMASLYGERSDAAAEIARHFDAGGDAAAAARAHRFAALRAHALFANDEALAHLERALALGPDDADLVEIHLLRAWLGHALGRSDSRTQSIAALSTLRIDAARLPEVERLRSTNAMLEGRFDVARDAAERSVRAALDTGDERAVALGHLEVATIAIVTDRYEAAGAALDAAAACIGDDETLHVRELRARTLLAQRRGTHGPELSTAAQLLLDGARRLGDPQAEAEAHVRMAHVNIAALQFARARTHFDAAVAAYQRFGNPRGVDSVQNNAANLALWACDYAAAHALYAKCFAFAEENGDEANMFGCALGMALAAIYTSDFERGRRAIDAIAHLRRPHDTLEDANRHLIDGLLATETGDERDAAGAYDRSLTIHRSRPPSALFALTLAFATLQAASSRPTRRASGFDAELAALPATLLCAEEFPHLMYWARARVALLGSDVESARDFRARAERLYEARVAPLADAAPAFAAVPWNARFLQSASDAFATLRA